MQQVIDEIAKMGTSEDPNKPDPETGLRPDPDWDPRASLRLFLIATTFSERSEKASAVRQAAATPGQLRLKGINRFVIPKPRKKGAPTSTSAGGLGGLRTGKSTLQAGIQI